MASIDATALKQLRTKRRWSQEELASRAKVDKQTVSRLERSNKGESQTRSHTVQQLAKALNVDEAILTGEVPVPEPQRESESVPPKSQFNVSVHKGVRNALYLIAERYNVRPWQVVELAPFLFCWAAEASLRQRRDRIGEVKSACETARKLERELRHLPIPDYSDSNAKIEAEVTSIDYQDLFGDLILEDPDVPGQCFPDDPGGGYDNPFARFLHGLAMEFRDVMTFDNFSSIDSPIYSVCSKEATLLVHGDTNLAKEILNGTVALFEMPKEIRDDVNARTEWVRVKAAEYWKQVFES